MLSMNSVRSLHLPIRLRKFLKHVAFSEVLPRTMQCRGLANNANFHTGINYLQGLERLTLSSILKFDIKLTIPLMCSSTVHVRSYATKPRSTSSPRQYYDVLEISPKANQAQIKSAYFRLSKLHHPDINKSKDAARRFAEISEAYEILSKATTRKMYDRGIIDPRDPRSSYRSSQYWDAQAGQTTQSRPRRPPPTGSSPIYDYDEWLRTRFGQAGFHNYGQFGVGNKMTFQQSRSFFRDRNEDADHNLRHRETIITRREFLAVVVISGLAIMALFSLTGIPGPPKMEEDESKSEKQQKK